MEMPTKGCLNRKGIEVGKEKKKAITRKDFGRQSLLFQFKEWEKYFSHLHLSQKASRPSEVDKNVPLALHFSIIPHMC